MIQVQILVGGIHKDHLGSPEATNRFLLITHDWRTRAYKKHAYVIQFCLRIQKMSFFMYDNYKCQKRRFKSDVTTFTR